MDEHVTEFTWNAGKTSDLRAATTEIKYSDTFALKSDPSAKFSLFVDCTQGYWEYIKFGVIAKNTTEIKPVIVRIQFWICDANGGKLHEHVVESFAFMNIDQNVSFGCKLTHLNPGLIQVLNFKDAFIQKLWNAYESELDFDMIILAGGKEFKVSRTILSAHSNIFRQMFSGNFKEGVTGTAELKNITAPAMEAFVKWMYVGEISDNAVIEGLFIAADKYMIQDLKSICADLMLKSMSEENASQRLVLSAKYNDKKLEQKALDFIHGKGTDFMYKIFQSNAWNDYMNMVRSSEN